MFGRFGWKCHVVRGQVGERHTTYLCSVDQQDVRRRVFVAHSGGCRGCGANGRQLQQRRRTRIQCRRTRDTGRGRPNGGRVGHTGGFKQGQQALFCYGCSSRCIGVVVLLLEKQTLDSLTRQSQGRRHRLIGVVSNETNDVFYLNLPLGRSALVVNCIGQKDKRAQWGRCGRRKWKGRVFQYFRSIGVGE